MQNEKSPGPNGIPPEAFKYLSPWGLRILTEIIQDYWLDNDNNGKIFTKLGLTILPKTGALTNPNKWRGIDLGDIAAKTIS